MIERHIVESFIIQKIPPCLPFPKGGIISLFSKEGLGEILWMKYFFIFLGILILLAGTFNFSLAENVAIQDVKKAQKPSGYAGSVSCRECHEKFYTLWSTSHHGLAMQPYTKTFAEKNLAPQTEDIEIKNRSYRFDINKGIVIESFKKNKKNYPVKHVMGGKYVYFLLTPMERGRLQVLPLSYDVRKKEWYDTTASFVRHFVEATDRPVDWKDPMLTFNTACYGCHVSQLKTNYDLKTDSYKSTWAEPGINCETCHGPGEEHNKITKATPKGQPLKDLKIISTKTMTPEQRDHMCATCHTKGGPIAAGFTPGDRYFDHFDLTTLEHPDFYPDGRDLGENYTCTLWMMSPCVKAGKLECMHCHTSSGRYRFKKEKFNDACMPCHEKHVKDPTAHTHHKPASEGSKCISCHMPKTEFARMERSDHSMRPPMPAASIAFKSPNACNICHGDKDARWADDFVRKWRTRDYQSPVIQVSGLIEAGRKRDWNRLEEMLTYITNKDRDQLYAASVIRLLMSCQNEKKWPVLMKALNDPSPLVRSAAAEGLQNYLTPQSVEALLKTTRDGYRLVRIRAASSLAAVPAEYIPEQQRNNFQSALNELKTSLMARPDDFGSHYNLGNFNMNLREYKDAAVSFETAIKLRPDAIVPYVNASMAYVNLGDKKKAEGSLRRALKIEPENAVANFNLGLLMAELGRMEDAEHALMTAFMSDPQMAPAAYNICIILAKDRIDEAIGFCRKASEIRPDNPKYGYTLAFYLYRKGEKDEAVRTLKAIVEKYPGYKDAEMLLGEIAKKEKKQ
jgi:tetratricopeptide (TPR) repeat protein